MRPALHESLASLEYEDETEVIANLNIPIAIVHGRKDKLVHSKYIEKLEIPTLWRDSIQKLKCGHSPHIECANEFNQLVDEFVSEN